MRRLVAAVAICVALGTHGADACLPTLPMPVRYEVGDLLTQYAIHADVIQIVRAGPGSVATDHDARTMREQRQGVNPTDFQLQVVRTLAGTPLSRSAGPLRIRAHGGEPPEYGASRYQYLGDLYATRPQVARPPHPEAEAYNRQYCSMLYATEEGDLYIAMRRHDGDLYRVSYSREMLAMEVRVVEFARGDPVRWQGEVPSLFRIRDLNDPIIAHLERRIREQHAARQARARAALWRDALRLIFGRPLPAPEH